MSTGGDDLKRVTSDTQISFTNKSARSDSAERAIINFSKGINKNDKRDFHSATVKCTPMKDGGKSWHEGGSDPKAPEHITVEFKDTAGNHVTTRHINKEGKSC